MSEKKSAKIKIMSAKNDDIEETLQKKTRQTSPLIPRKSCRLSSNPRKKN